MSAEPGMHSSELIALLNATRDRIGPHSGYGELEDDTFVPPMNASAEGADNAEMMAYLATQKADATLRRISMLITRVLRRDIPTAQKANYRARELKRRARICEDAKRSNAIAVKKHKLAVWRARAQLEQALADA